MPKSIGLARHEPELRYFVNVRWLFLLILLFLACSPDLDAALATPEEVLPLVPDDETIRDACVKCAFENCSDELASCKNDTRPGGCEQLRACKVKHSDPSTLLKCEQHYPAPAFDDPRFDDPDSNNTIFYNQYRDCVFKHECPIECHSGQNWGCVYKYEWDKNKKKGDENVVNVRVYQIGDLLTGMTEPGESSVLVALGIDVSHPKQTDGKGIVSFTGALPQQSSPELPFTITVKRGESGELSPDRLAYDYQIYGRPVVGPGKVQDITLYTPVSMEKPQENKITLTAMVYDCLGLPGYNARFQLTLPVQMADVRIRNQYWGFSLNTNKGVPPRDDEVPTVVEYVIENADLTGGQILELDEQKSGWHIVVEDIKESTFVIIYPHPKPTGTVINASPNIGSTGP
jgi:hypothetical protein